MSRGSWVSYGFKMATRASLPMSSNAMTPRLMQNSRGNSAAVAGIEKSGARVYADTCMVVSPVMEQYSAIMVNSGKALWPGGASSLKASPMK